jgi:hypothetical protein
MTTDKIKIPATPGLPDTSPALAGFAKEAAEFVARASALEIIGTATAIEANDMLGFIATSRKRLEEQRAFFVKPLNDHVKTINAQFKERQGPLDEADSIIRRKVIAWNTAQRAIAAVAPVSLPATRTAKSTLATTSTVPQVQFEIVDASLLPREYLIPNEGMIRAQVRAGVKNIPGVRTWTEDALRVRTK